LRLKSNKFRRPSQQPDLYATNLWNKN